MISTLKFRCNITFKRRASFLWCNARLVAVNFYKRNNLEFRKAKSLNEIVFDTTKKNLVVFEDQNNIKELHIEYSHIYSTIPEWLLQFNINDWVSRVTKFYVYEINVK